MSKIVWLKDGRKCKLVSEMDGVFIVNPYAVYTDYCGDDPDKEEQFEEPTDVLLQVSKVYGAPPVDVIDTECKKIIAEIEEKKKHLDLISVERERELSKLQQLQKQKTDVSKLIFNREELKNAKRLVVWIRDCISPRIMDKGRSLKLTVSYTIEQWGNTEEKVWAYKAWTDPESKWSNYSEYFDAAYGIKCDLTDEEILSITHKRQNDRKFTSCEINNANDKWLTPENLEIKRKEQGLDKIRAFDRAKEDLRKAQENLEKILANVPRYVHDCEMCVFLGQHGGYDLYFCPNEPTVLARWDNDPAAYSSGLTSSHDGIVKAKELAIAQGLLNPDTVVS